MKPAVKSALLLLCAFCAGAAVLPLAILSICLFGGMPVDAVSLPPAWEARIGQAALRASLARQSAGLADPIKGNDAELIAGMRLFRDNCSGCHGDQGKVSRWGSSDFYPRVPQFAQNPPRLTAPEMFVAVKNGIRYSGMFVNDDLSEKEIWSTVKFLSRLRSLPPAVDKAWKAKR